MVNIAMIKAIGHLCMISGVRTSAGEKIEECRMDPTPAPTTSGLTHFTTESEAETITVRSTSIWFMSLLKKCGPFLMPFCTVTLDSMETLCANF